MLSLRGLARHTRARTLGREDRSEAGENVREFPAYRFLMIVAIADTHTAIWQLFLRLATGESLSAWGYGESRFDKSCRGVAPRHAAPDRPYDSARRRRHQRRLETPQL